MLSRSSAAAAAGIASSTVRAASVTHIVRRRSQRSTSAPPSTPKSSHGSVPAAVTTASAIGSRVNVNAMSGSAACDTPSPSEDTVCAVHSRPNPVGNFRTSDVTWRPLRPARAMPGGTVRRRVMRPATRDRTAPGTRPPVPAAAPQLRELLLGEPQMRHPYVPLAIHRRRFQVRHRMPHQHIRPSLARIRQCDRPRGHCVVPLGDPRTFRVRTTFTRPACSSSRTW